MDGEDKIIVRGAREHNLKNINVEIPRNQLTVITGLSGSGKSSLAFDTIYAEGQRRYIETFSAYARSFLGNMERPDVDEITGLSPVISIEQKTTNKNPRSTVGTVTEIYDFLRLLFARAGEAFSYNTGEKMVKYTDEQIINLILEKFSGKRTMILAPVVRGRKGHYRELFDQIRKKGFLYARVDGEITEMSHGYKVDRYKIHNIEMVIDKLVVDGNDRKRLRDSVDIAMKHGQGIIMILDQVSGDTRFFSRHLMCPATGISYNDPAPHSFSFNSPQGACHKCNGLGEITEIDFEKLVPDPTLSIAKGGIAPLGPQKNTMIFWQIEALADKYGFTLKTPVGEIAEDSLNAILFGTGERIQLKNSPLGSSIDYMMTYEGIVKYILNQKSDNPSKTAQKWADQFHKNMTCPECNGQRLQKEPLHFKIDGKNISELAQLDVCELSDFFDGIETRLSSRQLQIATEVIKEIRTRLRFLIDVGLTYLSLDRPAGTLSGGESQRIRLATQIGSQLVNVLYILDEPSIGLHHRDNLRLINSLQQLRDTGNSVIVVEHDRDMMLQADYLIDMGPLAGIHGGEIVAAGLPSEVLKSNTLTAKYLTGKKKIEVPATRRPGNGKRYNRETLEVRFKGKSISDVLDMTINQGVEFFESIPAIVHRLRTIQEVGLGYITLGQASTTLSGGESQRVKLATELSKRDTGMTLYILDEPTTGLHFEDIRVLLEVLNKLVDKGNTVIVIEHNMEVIKVADHIIDIGPEGGKDGGHLLCSGSPEEIIAMNQSYTAKYLKEELGR